MRQLRLTLLLFAVALADAAAANVDPQHKIDQYVAGHMRQGQIPGVQVGIYRQGKVVFAKGSDSQSQRRALGRVLAQRVFEPLGMAATRIISDSEIIPNRASGYTLTEGVLRNQRWVAPFYNSTGDGAMYFNVLDLAKWDAARWWNHRGGTH